MDFITPADKMNKATRISKGIIRNNQIKCLIFTCELSKMKNRFAVGFFEKPTLVLKGKKIQSFKPMAVTWFSAFAYYRH